MSSCTIFYLHGFYATIILVRKHSKNLSRWVDGSLSEINKPINDINMQSGLRGFINKTAVLLVPATPYKRDGAAIT